MSADQLLRCGDIPAWKHLTDSPLTTDQRISLVADLFSNRDEIDTHKALNRSDAQSVIDVLNEVVQCSLLCQNDRSADMNPNHPIMLSRRWMACRRGSGGSVWPHYAGYAAITL